MQASFWIKLYLLLLPVFFAIDLVWLGVIAKGFYRQQLAAFLAPQVNWWAAITFYLLFIAGIVIFAVAPALRSDTPTRALWLGALFGFFTYATYDLTNLATIDRWPMPVVLVDIAWGSILCALVSRVGFSIAKYLS